MTTLSIETDVLVPSEDGVALQADVVRPSGPGRFPAVLMRTAYDRSSYAAVSLQVHTLALARAGYAVVLQDVRGRGGSGGSFSPFVNEQADGVASVLWIAEQPWCNGKVAMAGISYNAFCQLAVAVAAPEPLVAWIPGLSPFDVRTSWIREGGVLNLGFHLAWLLGAVLPGTPEVDQTWVRRAFASPLQTAAQGAAQEVLSSSPVGGWFSRWVEEEDPYPGDRRVPGRKSIATVEAPALVVAGWFDLFAPGSLELYRSLLASTTAPHALVVGPWDHSGLPLGRRSGDVDFGIDAAVDQHRLQLAWLDVHLRGADVIDPLVRMFVTGRNDWTQEPWLLPAAGSDEWYPAMDGGLYRIPPSDGFLRVELREDDPTPTVGGRLFPWEPVLRPGVFDRSLLRTRPDIAAFSSPPTLEDMTLRGPVDVEVAVIGDGSSVDVVAVLVDIDPGGRSFNIADGVTRVFCESDGQGRGTVSLGEVAHQLRPGHRIGLDLAAGSFPRFGVTYPTGPLHWCLGEGQTVLRLPRES